MPHFDIFISNVASKIQKFNMLQVLKLSNLRQNVIHAFFPGHAVQVVRMSWFYLCCGNQSLCLIMYILHNDVNIITKFHELAYWYILKCIFCLIINSNNSCISTVNGHSVTISFFFESIDIQVYMTMGPLVMVYICV